MLRVSLARGDGEPGGRPWLLSVVSLLQRGLNEAGSALLVDGRFGAATQSAVESYQQGVGLLPNAVVGKATWGALDPHLRAATQEEEGRLQQHLPGFLGDLPWVHEKEGHRGRPYWPGGASGVTLDPGVDLGHQEPEVLDELYSELLSVDERDLLRPVLGLRGEAARSALASSAEIRALRISADAARVLFPQAAGPYWAAISGRFPALRAASALPSVQTVLLSLAYNRGAHNHHLESLRPLLAQSNWIAAARKVRAMQQSHQLEGIRRRRREEGDLILAELEHLQA